MTCKTYFFIHVTERKLWPRSVSCISKFFDKQIVVAKMHVKFRLLANGSNFVL